MNAPLFVLGADFNVGKTALACAVLRSLGLRGQPAVGVKPVDTGCRYRDDHDLVSEDGEKLRAASSSSVPPLVAAPYRFPSRLEPVEAAAASGIELTAEDLVSTVNTAAQFGRAVVEGPGGPRTRLTTTMTTAGLASALGARVAIVLRIDRGLDEQVELTLPEARRAELDVRVIVPVSPGPVSNAADHGPRIEPPPGVPILPPFSASRDGQNVDDLARYLAEHAALEALLG